MAEKEITPKPERGAKKRQYLRESPYGWYLCSSAELRFNAALQYKAAILVDGLFLAKFYGRLCAMCLENFKGKNGDLFKAGFWYAPATETMREELRKAFDEGRGRVSFDEGQWVLLRGAENPEEISDPGVTRTEYLAQARAYAKTAPLTLPAVMGGVKRREFRERAEEMFRAETDAHLFED